VYGKACAPIVQPHTSDFKGSMALKQLLKVLLQHQAINLLARPLFLYVW